MWAFGSLSFGVPWALAAFGLLPALWWLLRAIPPSPRRQAFPALRLLIGLTTPERSVARTPLWLLLLRMVLAVAAITAAAHPILGTAPVRGGGPLLLVVDNGWAAAKLWPQRRAAMDRLVGEAAHAGRPVVVLTTAPPADGSPLAASRLLPAGEAQGVVQALAPLPWPVDRQAAGKALADVPGNGSMRVVWLADGLADGQSAAFGALLRRMGGLEVMEAPRDAVAKLLLPPRADGKDLTSRLRRLPAASPATVSVRAVDDAGRTLAVEQAGFAAGEGDRDVVLSMPAELRNRTSRIEIEGEATAGAVALLDDRWRRRPVGLIDDSAGRSTSPLLDDLFYAERALSSVADVRRGKVAELLGRSLSLAIMPDAGVMGEEDARALRAWVEQGGVLLRLAGPNLARNPDDLLPVRLRGGGRMLGGAMSWTQPMTLAPMPDNGPFSGLPVPKDLKIGTQLLAEPGPDLNDHTWARLEDGTPLVTGAPLGKGWLVLIHTTVGPAWGDLGLSGLFPQMLQRLLDLSQGFAGGIVDHPLAPAEVLDGFGQLGAPGGTVEAIPANAAPPSVGPRHPPGYYGDEGGRRAVNLATDIGPMQALSLPAGAKVTALGAAPLERDLQPFLLFAVLFLLLLDLLAVLALRGRFPRKGAAAMLAVFMACAMPAPGGGDARAASGQGMDIDLQAALQTRLAYVVTGDAQVDETSRAGLSGLSHVLERRTTASLGEPVGVDIGRDALMVFPLLYWPVTGGQGPLSSAAREKVNDFMRHGGLILFDTQDRGDGGSDKLRRLTSGLDIPALAAVTEEHVLTRSFYLLRDLPGRTEGAPVYAQDGGDPANDNVSPVIIGANDWAGAWAVDRRGTPIHAVVPGGEQQREMAYRFGVNLVMYALTGSYKADQVHLPAILERLKR
ncbi:DUF4159 domain-containing protein [Telmatospirillum siberiense]|uniref:LytTR family transcriptional regulator n=1 Tax=Telmatospirillum siberiense TaxID=382514 RepID=A0A2N3PTT7_9PROT|nr:DUF4159 domain-containing protein [Telmatospirillum siberiense]PKU23808.1 hypothetical protein CWS72_15090 [Telmatospirillum siberiense]